MCSIDTALRLPPFGLTPANLRPELLVEPVSLFAPCPYYLLLSPVAAQVVVLIGPVRSGKTNELVRRYQAALQGAAPKNLEPTLWLAPNGRTAAVVREQLVRHGLTASLRPGVLTFDDLTRQILTATNDLLKPLDSVLVRDLLRRVVAQALTSNNLSFFAESATRPGFIDLLAEHIAELQRRDIRPDAYATATSRRADDGPRNELASLYADYIALLTKHNLTDAETAHIAARNALAQNNCRRFKCLELIVVDGFTDFTRTQLTLIDLLAQRATQLHISLPADNLPEHLPTGRFSDQPSRPDLFAKTAATLSDLRHHFPNLQLRQIEPRPLSFPAIDHIAQQIFRNPKHVVTAKRQPYWNHFHNSKSSKPPALKMKSYKSLDA